MKSRTPLVLMEQLAMVLVFAMAAALCLQAFVFSGQLSRRNEARDRAAVKAQNAAETLKAVGAMTDDVRTEAARLMGGRVVDGMLCVYYDADWNTTADEASASYRLCAKEIDAGVDGLDKAEVWVSESGSDDRLFALSVAWQEGRAYG